MGEQEKPKGKSSKIAGQSKMPAGDSPCRSICPAGTDFPCRLEDIALDTSINAISFADIQGKVTYANRAFLDLLGFKDKEEVLGRPTYEFWASQDAAVKMRKELFEKGRWIGEMTARKKDGSLFYARLSAHLVNDESGRPRCTMAFFVDITETKQTIEALKQSENNFKMLFYGAAEGIIAADIETKRFEYANPAACRLLGFSEEEMTKLSVTDIHPKEYHARILDDFDRQVGGEKSLLEDFPCVRKDGSIIYAEIKAAKILIDGKEYAFGFFTDITQRKHDEEALRESEQRYHLLVEQLPAIIYTAALDEASTTLYISPQVQEIMGVSPDDYKANPDLWRRLLHPDDCQRVMTELEKSHKTGKQFRSEYRIIAKDGRVVWFRDDARIVEDAKGKPLYLQGVMYDITERKKAEEELRKASDELEIRVQQRTADLARVNEELRREMAERKRAEKARADVEKRFEDIFENALVGIYRTTPEGQILMANPALVKMLGFSCFEELSKRNLNKNGFEPTHPRSSFKQIMARQGSVVGLESVWLRQDGTRIVVRESAIAVRDEKGKVLYYEGTVEDVTERKKAEEKLLAYQKQLRSLALELSLAEERLRRQMAMNVHDHLGQNLAISKIKLDGLRKLLKTAEKVKEIDQIRKLITETIESVRSLTFELSPPVLYELGFEAAVEWLVRFICRRDGLVSEFSDDGKSKPLGEDVRVLLFQSVRELLVNISKHAHAKKISVAVSRTNAEIQVRVADDGVGFDVNSIRLSDTKAKGFGLFSVSERLASIGGRFEIESKTGAGTKVLLAAPVSKKRSGKGGKGK